MSTSKTKQFFRLFMVHHTRIYTFILMCVPHEADADDIAQDTATVMWEKFDTFSPGTDFVKWGKTIAYNKILDYRKKKARQHVIFSDAMLATLAHEAENSLDQVDPRLEALKSCLRKLNTDDRTLLRHRYEESLTIKRIAEQAQRSVQGLYKVMARIHSRLVECVNRRLVGEGTLP